MVDSKKLHVSLSCILRLKRSSLFAAAVFSHLLHADIGFDTDHRPSLHIRVRPSASWAMAPPPIQSRWAQSLEESDTNSDYDNSNDNHNDDNNNNNNMMNQTDGAAEIDIDDQTRHRNMVAVQMVGY